MKPGDIVNGKITNILGYGAFVLVEEYDGITLIENPYYDSCNNISSLYVARDYIENSIILDGDQMVYNPNVLAPLKHIKKCQCLCIIFQLLLLCQFHIKALRRRRRSCYGN